MTEYITSPGRHNSKYHCMNSQKKQILSPRTLIDFILRDRLQKILRFGSTALLHKLGSSPECQGRSLEVMIGGPGATTQCTPLTLGCLCPKPGTNVV